MKKEKIYHYTDAGAVLSIVKDSKFRATNIMSFSDKKELVGGLAPLRRTFRAFLQNSTPSGFAIFLSKRLKLFFEQKISINVISFCSDRNYSYMWNHYAKNDGCCICFNKEKLLNAFNQYTIPIRKTDYPLKPVNESFIRCRYIPGNLLPHEAEKHLNELKAKYTNGTDAPISLNTANVRVDRLTWEIVKDPEGTAKRDIGDVSVSLEDSFINFIGIALCAKMAKTKFNYEKEKEERLIFHPPEKYPQKTKEVSSNNSGCQKTRKEYIEIILNKELFLSSIEEILINPRTKNRADLAKNVKEKIKEYYANTGIEPPPVKQMADKNKIKSFKRNKNLKRYMKNKIRCQKANPQGSMCYRGE